jgi:hypothetical protein
VSILTTTKGDIRQQGIECRSVLIEGMDCAGKSSAVRGAVARTGVEARSKQFHSDSRILADERLRNCGDFIAKGWAYADAIALELRLQQMPTGAFIQESLMVVKSAAMLRAWNAPSDLLARYDELLMAYPRFDSALALTVDAKERERRLTERMHREPASVTQNDRRILDDPHGFAATDDAMLFIMTKHFNATIVDTTSMSPEEVSSTVVDALVG